jgi:radical SAM superfamily enzyme YgiQ (UPF0313 family)
MENFKTALIEPAGYSECLITEIFWQIRCSLPFLSGVLKKEGIFCRVFCEELINIRPLYSSLARNYRIFGISVTINTVLRGLEIAREIKNRAPRAIIIFGGPVTNHFAAKLLEIGDFCIPGRGEYPLVNLINLIKNTFKNKNLSQNKQKQTIKKDLNIKDLNINALNIKDLSAIKGLIFKDTKKNKTKNITENTKKYSPNSNPNSSTDTLLIHTPPENRWLDSESDFSSVFNFGGFSEKKNIFHIKKPPVYSLFYSTGCVNNCKFCFTEKKYRTRQIKNVIADLRAILSMHKTFFRPRIMLVDDCAFGNENKFPLLLKALAEVRKEKAFDLFLQFHVQPLVKNPGLTVLMKKAGVTTLLMGFETIHGPSLVSQNKKITKEQIIESLKICRKAKITPYGYFMAGFETDTCSCVNDIFNFIVEQKLIAQVLPMGVMDHSTLDPYSFGASMKVSLKPAFTSPCNLQKLLINGYNRIYSLKRLFFMPNIRESLFQIACAAAWKKWKKSLKSHAHYLELLDRFK